MAKRTLTDVLPNLEDWDVDLRDSLNALGMDTNPMTVPEKSTPGSLPAANQHDRSIEFINHDQLGWIMVASDGTQWNCIAMPWQLGLGRSLAGPRTAVDPVADAGMTFDQNDRVYAFPLVIYAHATNFGHLNGSDPGDWTLTVENKTAVTSVTATLPISGSNWPITIVTAGKFDSDAVLTLAAGEKLHAGFTGPSCDTPIINTTLHGIIHVPHILA